MVDEILKLESDEEPVVKQKLIDGIVEAVRHTFRVDLKRTPGMKVTQKEITRRTHLAAEMVRDLRYGTDTGYSWMRIVSELPRMLRARLDGQPVDPEKKRTIWTPEDARTTPTVQDQVRLILPGHF